MTELGITQEYLLLAVNDRGRFSPLNPQQPICFVAAALGELTEAGCIAFTGEKVGLAGPLTEGLRCLKPLYDFIDRPRPVPLAMALRDFSPDGPKLAELAETVGESLEALGLKVYRHYSIEGYPYDIPRIVSVVADQQLGVAWDVIVTGQHLVSVV